MNEEKCTSYGNGLRLGALTETSGPGYGDDSSEVRSAVWCRGGGSGRLYGRLGRTETDYAISDGTTDNCQEENEGIGCPYNLEDDYGGPI